MSTSIAPTNSAQRAGATASAASAATMQSAADQADRFMTLLVAQMRNQDPLNPLDNAQMTSQIAQINTVGGIEKLNRTVTSLLSAFDTMLAQSALQLPGRDVLVAGDGLTLAGGQATGGFELAKAAEQVTVEVLDAAGEVVQRIPVGASPAGARSFTWDGTRADGKAAPEGAYRFRVTASAGEQAVAVQPLESARVRSVHNGSNGVQVDLGDAGVVNANDIKSFL